jgi:hypothetical protein
MFIQDMLALTPTLTIMGLFMLYRDNILCMWGCNPQMQTMIEFGRESLRNQFEALQRYTVYTVLHMQAFFANLPDVARSYIPRQMIQMVLDKYHTTDMNQMSSYLYIVFTLASATFLFYMVILSENRNYAIEPNEDTKKVQYIHRPITRSMSRQGLTDSVSSFVSSKIVF